MKPSLQLKMGQQLTMTPQLQQAIKLLQLSTLDLQQVIQETLEANPMLEAAEDENSQETTTDNKEPLLDNGATIKADEENESSETWTDIIPETLPVDSSWEDTYPNLSNTSQTKSNAEFSDIESYTTTKDSIRDHLLWQLNLTTMTDRDRIIALTIIDSIEPSGRLQTSLESIQATVIYELGLHNDIENQDIELDEVEMVLHRLQHFEPKGVCARDLAECLIIQLNQLPSATPWLDKAKLILSEHIHLIGNRDYAQLIRRTKLKEAELKEVIQLIQTLDPKPGEIISDSQADYIIPDATVKKVKGRWVVSLNSDSTPKIQINSNYASMVKRADTSSDNNYLREHLQEARWFIKSLQSRNETLLKVAAEIVSIQQDFLEYGEEAMKPLVLHDIANAVDMHESTISRVTTQKYMLTPRGIFELKYFFSSCVNTDSGSGCSSTAIRAIIKKLVTAELPKKPLSDSKIAAILSDQGIKIARRTIAKYRESLSIPPSNERKRLV